jgi:formate dehydrogenase major subunit
MFEEMEHGRLRALYVIGENPAQSEADQTRAMRLLGGLEHVVVQDMFLTRTAEMAHVVFPAAASWCEDEGTVTSSERRVQRVRKALEPPGQARPDLEILVELGPAHGLRPRQPGRRARVGRAAHALDLARRDELRAPRGRERAAVAVSRRVAPRSPYLHGRLWDDPPGGPLAIFVPTEHDPPGRPAHRGLPDPPHDRPPAGLLQHGGADRRVLVAAAAR